jgi:pyruvate,water dikinase
LPPHSLVGQGCSPGVVEGTAKIVFSSSDNLDLDGQILVTSRTDPGWIPLYPSLAGLLVERGGLLSHSAIVAREMGLPTIVGIKGLLDRVRNGQRIRMDGTSGVIQLVIDQTAADVVLEPSEQECVVGSL